MHLAPHNKVSSSTTAVYTQSCSYTPALLQLPRSGRHVRKHNGAKTPGQGWKRDDEHASLTATQQVNPLVSLRPSY